MNVDDVIEEIITDLAAGLIDASDEEIAEKLAKYDLSPEDMEDVMQTIQDVRDAEATEDIHAAGEDLDKVDAMADTQAQSMANEDNTPVTVTKEDKDSDGDADKVTIEQDGNEDDLSNEAHSAIDTLVNNSDELKESADFQNESEDHSSEEADKPHDEENSTNQIANHLANYRF